MFNASFTIESDQETTGEMLRDILSGMGFQMDHPGRDRNDKIRLKAVDGDKLQMRSFLSGGLDAAGKTGALRCGVEATVMAGDGGESLLYISIYPVMQHFDLPAIEGISESHGEHEEHEKACRNLLEELCSSIAGKMSGVREIFRNLPMRKQYCIPASRAPPVVGVQEGITGILDDLDFEVIRIVKGGSRREVHIKAMNRSRFHAIGSVLRTMGLAPYLDRAQRVAVEFNITPLVPSDGEKGTPVKISVALYPAMEFWDMEEVHGLSAGIEEELTDSNVCRNMWEKLVAKLEERFELTG